MDFKNSSTLRQFNKLFIAVTILLLVSSSLEALSYEEQRSLSKILVGITTRIANTLHASFKEIEGQVVAVNDLAYVHFPSSFPGVGTEVHFYRPGRENAYNSGEYGRVVEKLGTGKVLKGRKTLSICSYAGNKLSRGDIAVIRPSIKTAVVVPVEIIGMAAPNLQVVFDELIITSLLDQGTFRIVTRNSLGPMLKELKFQHSGLVDPTTAKEFGKLFGCDFIIVPQIFATDQPTFMVTVVDVETSLIKGGAVIQGLPKSIMSSP